MTSATITTGLPPKEAIERALTDQLERPEIWAEALMQLAETDSECRTDALLLMQLAQPVRQFLSLVASGNTEFNRMQLQVNLLLSALDTRPSTVVLKSRPNQDGYLLTLVPDVGTTPSVDEYYEEEDKTHATRDFDTLTELRVPVEKLLRAENHE